MCIVHFLFKKCVFKTCTENRSIIEDVYGSIIEDIYFLVFKTCTENEIIINIYIYTFIYNTNIKWKKY